MSRNNQREKKKSTRIVAMTIRFLLLVGILSYLFLLSKNHTKFNQESPSALTSTTNIQDLQDRIQYLETKVNSYLSYTSDPFLRTRTPVKCKNMEFIKNIECGYSISFFSTVKK